MNELPHGWTVEPFNRVARYATGKTPSRANPAYWNTGDDQVAWVAISDMTEYGTVTATTETISSEAFRGVFRGQIVPAGTLLMSFKLTIGRVATLGIPACHNEAIISIYPREDVDKQYLGYYLSQIDYSDHQDRQVKGNTLNRSKIDRIPIVLPPLAEQRLISGVLDRCQAGISAERAAERTASELKRALMQQLFTRGLRGEPQRDTELGLMPEGWEAAELGKVCVLSTGTTPATKARHYYEGTIPFIRTADIVNNRIRKAVTHVSEQAVNDYSLKLFPAGTVLMAMYGQGKTRGQVSLLEIAATTTQNAAAIQPLDEVSGEYLWHYLLSCYDRLRGMGSLGHLSHLNLGYLRDFLFAKPPLGEQKEIAVVLDAVDRKVDLHRQKRGVFEELFDSLLHNLMTAEISVADLDLLALTAVRAEQAEATT